MASETDKQFMQKAIDLAYENVTAGTGGPFGAVVVKNGDVIGQGANTVTSNNDPTAHAEVNAIRDACRNLGTFHLTGCTIYSSCQPCPMCLAAIYWAHIEKLFYACTNQDAANIGFDDDYILREISKDIDQQIIPAEQLMHDEAMKPFESWDNSGDRIEY